MTTDRFSAPLEIGASVSARADRALRGFARALEEGSALIDARFGHPPARLVIGGFVVWVAFVACMLDSVSVLRDLAGIVVPGAQ